MIIIKLIKKLDRRKKKPIYRLYLVNEKKSLDKLYIYMYM